jgi:hypothetical protein
MDSLFSIAQGFADAISAGSLHRWLALWPTVKRQQKRATLH